MKTVRIGTVWAITCVVSTWSCSTTDATSTKDTDASAGTGGASSGGVRTGGATSSGGKQGSGGSSSGGTSSGGSSGTGGRGSGGGDASTDGPAEGAPNDSGALVCSNTDAGRDAGKHWRDFSSKQCKPCPAAVSLTCQDLLAAPGPSFDPSTRVLTLHVTPGKTEIATARFLFNFAIVLGDGGGLTGNSSAAATIDQDTVTVDLSKALLGSGRHLGDYPASETLIDAGNLSIKDACGATMVTLNSKDGIRITTTDGGTPTVVCHKVL